MNELVIKHSSLAETVSHLIEHYIESADNDIIDLHQMVIEQIEPPLLRAVMERYKYNQSRAAKALGISRGTLRMLLIKYFDDHYCGRRSNNETL
ncbi:helix-turn-helix domain-containing protein [Legionella pneumophila serogroup 1]|uniref:helix-turn-helix domain-containing protein n=1 Tax=Legionella pneumophila TaxID=446 RepID=UPI0039C4818F|nr:Fis family transcriptional regulator [Legionella pneumophila subsp. pneumophila]